MRDTLEYFVFEQLVQELTKNINNELDFGTEEEDDDDLQIDVQIKSVVAVTDHTFFPANVTVRQRKRQSEIVTNTCTSNRCAAKVIVASNEPINGALLARAVELVQRKGFKDVFIRKEWVTGKKPLKPNKKIWEVSFKYRLRVLKESPGGRPSSVDRR